MVGGQAWQAGGWAAGFPARPSLPTPFPRLPTPPPQDYPSGTACSCVVFTARPGPGRGAGRGDAAASRGQRAGACRPEIDLIAHARQGALTALPHPLPPLLPQEHYKIITGSPVNVPDYVKDIVFKKARQSALWRGGAACEARAVARRRPARLRLPPAASPNPPALLSYLQGCSFREPDFTPQTDITVPLTTWDDLTTMCAQSRLYAGVHFQPAIDSAVQLCKSYGTACAHKVQALLAGTA